MEKNLKGIIIIIIILVLIAICIGIFINYKNNNKNENGNIINETEENNVLEQEVNNSSEDTAIIDSKIANMDESARMRAYWGKFIDAIETKDYNTAYNYLNDNFKSKYFETIEEFSEYIETMYPQNKIAIKYENIERKGELFVLEMSIYDSEDSSYSPLSQMVVIRENSVNNFTMSFSKIIEKGERG